MVSQNTWAESMKRTVCWHRHASVPSHLIHGKLPCLAAALAEEKPCITKTCDDCIRKAEGRPLNLNMFLCVACIIIRAYMQNISSFRIICSNWRCQINRLHARGINLIRLRCAFTFQAFNQNKTFLHAHNDIDLQKIYCVLGTII